MSATTHTLIAGTTYVTVTTIGASTTYSITDSSQNPLNIAEVRDALYAASYVLPAGFIYWPTSIAYNSELTTVSVLAAAIHENIVNPHSPVSVNFNILVDAASGVSVFGDEFSAPNNVVDAEYALPVNALYDSVDTKGLLEMWEPADAQGDIKVKFASVDSSASGGADLTGAYEVTLKKLAKGLQKVLCDNLDCSAAAPFNESKYAGTVEYTTQRDFGRLALGALAHYFFGHVDATAAITNDAAFVKNMLSVTAGEEDETSGGAAARYGAWTKASALSTVAIENWATDEVLGAASGTDANLAVRLALAVYNKGVSGGSLVESSVAANDAASLANIVRQVIGQDAQRTKNRDGSERTINAHQLVRFYAGDVIYVNIKVKRPSVSVGAGQGGVSSASLLNNYLEQNEQNYAIKITLGARDASL